MREILFKAKTKRGTWIEGDLIHYESGEVAILEKFSKYGYEATEISRRRIVLADTVCQYTGLTDNNGCKIWENDVVRGHNNPNDLAKVVLGEFSVIEVESLEKIDGVVGWHTEVIPTDAISKCEPFCLPMPLTDFYVKQSEWEVIGNIFDNPELLEN